MSNETKWAWDGGDRFSIGGRMYTGAEVAELLDRYEQQDRMKTREINLIVPENKALEAKAKRVEALEAALRETASYEASLRRDLESLRMRFADSISRHNAEKAALQERIELMEAANVSEELWICQRIEQFEAALREAERERDSAIDALTTTQADWSEEREQFADEVNAYRIMLREAEAKAAGYKQSVEYALDRFGAIGSMSDWTDSDLSDATQEARDAAGTLKRNVRLLQQPRAGEIR